MIDEGGIKAEMRLHALEVLVTLQAIKQSPSVEQLKAEHHMIRSAIGQTTLGKGFDPVASDLLMAELGEAVEKLLQMQLDYAAKG